MASGGEKDDEKIQGQLNIAADKTDEVNVGENTCKVECPDTKNPENLPVVDFRTESIKDGSSLYDKTSVRAFITNANRVSEARNIVNIGMAENEKESSDDDFEETDGGMSSGEPHSFKNKSSAMGHQAWTEQGASIHPAHHAAGISLSAVDAGSVSQYCMCSASRSLNIAGNSCVYVQVYIDDDLVKKIKQEGKLSAEISTKGVFARLFWSGLPTNSDYHEGKINIDIENVCQKEKVFNECVKMLVADGAHNAQTIVEKMLKELGICITQFAQGSIQMLYVTQRTICKDDEAIITTIVEEVIISNKISEITETKIKLKVTVEHSDDLQPFPSEHMLPQSQGNWNQTPTAEDMKHLISKTVSQESQQIKKEVTSVIIARQQEQEKVTQGMIGKLEQNMADEFSRIKLEIQKLVQHKDVERQQYVTTDSAVAQTTTSQEHECSGYGQEHEGPEYGREHEGPEYGQEPLDKVEEPTRANYDQQNEDVQKPLSLDVSRINIDPKRSGEITLPVDSSIEEGVELHDTPSPAETAALPFPLRRQNPDFYKVMKKSDESLYADRPSTDNKDLEDAEKDLLEENKDLVSAVNHFHEKSFCDKTLEKLHNIIQRVTEKQRRCELPKAEHGMNSVLCLDVSKNMERYLKDVKELLKKFMNEIEENTMLEGTHLEENIGLVFFGDQVEVKCLLTNEFECINKNLGLEGRKELKAGSTNNRPLLEALLTSLVVIKESKPSNSILEIGRQNYPVRPRVVLITSDGVNDLTTCQTLDSLTIIMKHTDVDFSIDSVPIGHSTQKFKILEDLARKTGGRFLPSDRQWELGRHYRQQYVIGQTLDRIYSRTRPDLPSAKHFEELAEKFFLTEREKEHLWSQLTKFHLSPPVTGTITSGSLQPPPVPGSTHTPTENVPFKHPPTMKKPPLKKGDYVQRGPDWQYGDQDGGKGCRGEVCSAEKDKTVEVKWLVTKVKDKYRYGQENKYEVELVAESGSADGSSIRKQLKASQGADPGLSFVPRQATAEEYPAGRPLYQGTKYLEHEPDDLEVDAGVWKDENTSAVKQTVTWQWKDRGDNWRLFSDQQISQIENFYQKKSTCVIEEHGDKKYQLDFQRLKRRDMSTGNYQDIRRKEMSMEDLHKLKNLAKLVSYWKD